MFDTPCILLCCFVHCKEDQSGDETDDNCGGAELMLLGFISLLLSVFQGAAQKICVRESIMHHMLPCPLPPRAGAKYGAAAFTGVLGGARRLLAGGGAASDYCQRKVYILLSRNIPKF